MEKQHLRPICFTAPAVFSAAAEGDRKISGVAYSGGLVTDHPFFDGIVIDLATTKFATPAPLLLDHKTPIGVVDSKKISNSLEISARVFADDGGDGQSVTDKADRGFPWQQSVGVWPGRIENVGKGSSVELNGRKFTGPLTVFRDNRVREVSLCALGADDKTSATFTAVSEGGERPPALIDQPEDTMDKDAQIADLTAKLSAATDTNKQLSDKIAARDADDVKKAQAQRVDEVKALFKATGREYKDEAAKPYLEMSAETFAAVSADLKSGKPKLDPKLLSAGATGDSAADLPAEGGDADTIARKAEAFRHEFKTKFGRELSVSDAVAHVTGKRPINV